MIFNQITYGQDADNNRGVKVWEYEFEHTKAERDEIAESAYLYFQDGITSGKETIILINPHNEEEMEIEIEIEDYIDLLIEKAKSDETLDDDDKIEMAGIDICGYDHVENLSQEDLVKEHIERSFEIWLTNLQIRNDFLKCGNAGVSAEDAIIGLEKIGRY